MASEGTKPVKVVPWQLIFLLAIHEEERLVLPNRAANGTTELVQIEFFRRRREKALRIQRRIPQELKQAAVEVVGARLRGDQNGRPRRGFRIPRNSCTSKP